MLIQGVDKDNPGAYFSVTSAAHAMKRKKHSLRRGNVVLSKTSDRGDDFFPHSH
jgi:hypothetical protein